MAIELHISVSTIEELRDELIKQLEVFHVVPSKEVTITKLPPDPRFHGSNVVSIVDKLRYHIQQEVEIGNNFSSTGTRMYLGIQKGNMQNALQRLKQLGEIKMVQKGIWQRVI